MRLSSFCAPRHPRCTGMPPRLFATWDDLPARVRAADKGRIAPRQLLSGALHAGVLIKLFGELAAWRGVDPYCFQECVAALDQLLPGRGLRRGPEAELG